MTITRGLKNDLDLSKIKPSDHPRYSTNLYRWLTNRNRPHRKWTSHVYRDQYGRMWIGMIDRIDSQNWDFIGARLIAVLCNGSSEGSACYPHLRHIERITDFWQQYTARGRCAIDEEHQMHFVGDETRWDISGDKRYCRWCCNHTQSRVLWTEFVCRERWELQT